MKRRVKTARGLVTGLKWLARSSRTGRFDIVASPNHSFLGFGFIHPTTGACFSFGGDGPRHV